MSVFDSRSSGTGLLVRLGFADPSSTALALEQVGVWRDGRPVDEAAGEVVTALADVADPDLALSTLVRLLDAAPDGDALRRALCDAVPGARVIPARAAPGVRREVAAPRAPQARDQRVSP